MAASSSAMPNPPPTVRFSCHTAMPNRKGMIREKEAIMLVRAIGPVASARKPVCMEMHSATP